MSLSDLSNKTDAYVMPVLFDHEVHPLFIKSVQDIVEEYSDAKRFAIFLKKAFENSKGGTDINAALNFAKQIYDTLDSQSTLAKFGGPDHVRPIPQVVSTANGGQITVPNVRVLIYTDGEDETTGKILGNPFQSHSADILLGAFFGVGTERGSVDLQSVLSNCPTHTQKQFFLLNSEDRVQKLRFLFRMASGGSGFCPRCLMKIVDQSA